MKIIYQMLAHKLRLSNPWNYKVPVLICVPYLLFLIADFGWQDALIGIAWAFCTIIGIAGFGYLSNDFGDRKADLAAGKANLLAEISFGKTLLLLILFLALALLPWFLYFPVTKLSAALLAGEFLLFVLYIFPPFRLKERGMLGLFTDALYAHVNPVILAALTFQQLAKFEILGFEWLFGAFAVWQLFLGMRNILLHQIKDHENDLKSGIKTFSTQVGIDKANVWLGQFFAPLEIIFFVLFLAVLSVFTWLPIVAWFMYLLWAMLQKGHPKTLRSWLYQYMDDFYIQWFPICILVALSLEEAGMLILLGMQILLFKTVLANSRDRFFRFILSKG